MRRELNFKTTEEIEIPKLLVDQVVGQDQSVAIIKKAASQRRNVLLIGAPGTGKSMIGQALAALLPKEKLVDVICLPNMKDENNPVVKTVPAGQGKKIEIRSKIKGLAPDRDRSIMVFLALFVALSVISYAIDWIVSIEGSDVLKAADRISGTIFIIAFMLIAIIFYSTYKMRAGRDTKMFAPKVIVDNTGKTTAPFIDATGSHEGSLLGDVRHDPFQSGGLGTPAHERVESGAIHKANQGVLFIDEIATLKPEMQIEILTAMQERKYAITGRSERSAGATVKTEPVPCDFILLAAGNLQTIRNVHPALRSRIRGYGYEVYMNTTMEDTAENRKKLARIVAQEVINDGKIPHFTREAVLEIINVARRMAGKKGYLSLKIRDIGGMIRAAGDLAKEKRAKYVEKKHIKAARKVALSLEHQIAERFIRDKKEYQVIRCTGVAVGRVNGLAVIADSDSGLILPIEAAITPSLAREHGEIIATGQLGKMAKEAVENVSAIIKRYSGKDVSSFDIHIQFIQTYEGVEGDSASISIGASMISALENIEVRQDTAMTGSLSVRGEVLPVGGINAKLDAALEAGIKRVIIPKMNEKDVLLDKKDRKRLEIIPVSNMAEVIEHAFHWKSSSKKVLGKIRRAVL
jgi:Lon-like ATP-dependent protease